MKPPYGKVDPYPQRHGRGSRPRRANLNSCLLLINCLSRLAHCDESTTAVVRTGVFVRCCQSLCIQRTGETASFFQHSSTQEQQNLWRVRTQNPGSHHLFFKCRRILTQRRACECPEHAEDPGDTSNHNHSFVLTLSKPLFPNVSCLVGWAGYVGQN